MINYRQSRITDPKVIDFEYIDNELKEGKQLTVQFSASTYSEVMLSQLNMLCDKYDSNFGVRFYGNYSDSFDFKTLLKIPNVKSLSVDCLTRAENVSVLGELIFLQKLSLGVFELKETEILNLGNLKKLRELILTDTKTKALNLDYLKDYKALKLLIICGHTKNLNAVGDLVGLEYLSLNSVKKVSVSFVNRLANLKTLKFILGSRENINEISENNIEHLEIVWVRGFNDLSCISYFKNLKTLLIEDNIQLHNIDFTVEFGYLKTLKILNCKKLDSLKGINNLKVLEQIIISKTALDFELFISQDLPKTVDYVGFYTFKSKIDEDIKNRIVEAGYKTR